MASVASLRDLLEALIQSSLESGKLEGVTGDLERFFKFIKAQDGVRKVLATPAYDAGERKSIVIDIGEKAGFDAYTSNFLGLVIEFGKFKALLESREPVLRKLRAASGKVVCEVTLASEPSPWEVDRINDAFKKGEARDVEVVVKVDPGILGGVIAKVEDRVYDGTLRAQLGRIKNALGSVI
ncbi:MAG: ATP synthase F1 subunit delta [Thermodesulfobacteriota bacterium]